MLDIRAQVREGQRRQSKGLNTQLEDINKGEISEFIQYKIIEYGFYNIIDNDLQELYYNNFSTFILEVFKNCNRTTVRDLRHFLRVHGVWVKKDRRVTAAQSLFDTLQEEDPTEWTELKIREYKATRREFNLG